MAGKPGLRWSDIETLRLLALGTGKTLQRLSRYPSMPIAAYSRPINSGIPFSASLIPGFRSPELSGSLKPGAMLFGPFQGRFNN